MKREWITLAAAYMVGLALVYLLAIRPTQSLKQEYMQQKKRAGTKVQDQNKLQKLLLTRKTLDTRIGELKNPLNNTLWIGEMEKITTPLDIQWIGVDPIIQKTDSLGLIIHHTVYLRAEFNSLTQAVYAIERRQRELGTISGMLITPTVSKKNTETLELKLVIEVRK